MADITKIAVDLGDRSYDINIGQGIYEKVFDLVPADLKNQPSFIITDDNIEKKYAWAVKEIIESGSSAPVSIFTLPAGEKSKSMENYSRILSWLLDNNVNRKSVVFAIGGGVTGDIAGFAAATIMRGVPYIQVPTTLLAAVDSSVGGKTAINTSQGKNLVGAFYQPLSVLCDIESLKTLPERELLAGYAEIVKYGLIGDADFFGWLDDNSDRIINLEPEALSYAISMSCKKKAEIVSRDEREGGVRTLLNFGHTFAHMLERAVAYDGRLLHGEAVSIGMVMATNLSAMLGLCNQEDVTAVRNHLSAVGLPVTIADIEGFDPVDAVELQQHFKHDKKATADGIVFILTKSIGNAFINIDEIEVSDAIITDLIESSIRGE
jgi:3-dehydroquinate synthase